MPPRKKAERKENKNRQYIYYGHFPFGRLVTKAEDAEIAVKVDYPIPSKSGRK
jgi:hypothetical protein